ncbi:Flagellar hook-length control protein FliK [Marisediminitalea aggregata]|uniref:Flagellar hook-length control protein FliK n=2 Tax=Marisediminitalea aggregata TaxID=634436 RepID=A0A1M5GMV3_9ALTE|nr:Flagellar hook-length control protein FliK [Marisediminitalea aggregata]
MQQLATQGSQIAALPDNPVTLSPDSTQTSAESGQFADVFSQHQRALERPGKAAQAAPKSEAVPPQTAPKNADDAATQTEQDSIPTESVEASEQVQAATVDKTVTSGNSQNTSSTATTDDVSTSESADLANTDDVSLNTLPDAVIPAVEVDNTASETDYLALVEALRTFEQKWPGVTGDKQPLPAEVAPEMKPPVDGLDVHQLENGKAQIIEDLNALMAQIAEAPELDASGQSAAITVEQSEAILADFMTLIAQFKGKADKSEVKGAEGNDGASLEKPVQPTLGLTDNVLPVEVQTENAELAADVDTDTALAPQPLSVAISLLSKIEALNKKDNAEIAPEQELVTQIADADTMLTLDVEQINESVIEVEESADPLLNQAAMLVGLMTQPTADKTASSGQVAAAKTEAVINPADSVVALESMLEQASDDTLAKVAQVITDTASAANPELSAAQQSQMKGMLVSGMEEMRAQLKQGHQPAIDLTALVAQVSAEVQPEQPVLPQQLLQDAQHIAQLAATSVMSDQKELQLNELLHNTRDLITQETRQQHSETVKSIQQQAALDKPVPLNQPQGQQQLAEKIRWMVNGRQSMAEIRLDPPEMGSMQIRLNVSGDSASVSFVVQSQHAKEMLADAMPRLRDMFSEQGIDLGESFVSQQQTGEQGEQQSGGQSGGGFDDNVPEDAKMNETRVVRQANGLIDDYV